jgi:hypothetical protein
MAKPPLWWPGAVIIFAENRGGRVRVGARWRRPRRAFKEFGDKGFLRRLTLATAWARASTG